MAARRWIGAGGVSAAGFAAARALSTHVSVIGTSLCGFKAAFRTRRGLTGELRHAPGLHWKTDETRLRQAFTKFGKLEHGTWRYMRG